MICFFVGDEPVPVNSMSHIVDQLWVTHIDMVDITIKSTDVLSMTDY